MTSLAEARVLEIASYGQKILQLATCQEIQLYQEIIDRQNTIKAHDGHLANLQIALENAKQTYEQELETFQSMGCKWATPECLAQQAIVEEKFAIYEEQVAEYNRVVDLRNWEVNQLNTAVDQFNALMDINNQGCAVVYSERIPVPEESE
jgi:hypothetical protein